jgi:hypothetical protein
MPAPLLPAAIAVMRWLALPAQALWLDLSDAAAAQQADAVRLLERPAAASPRLVLLARPSPALAGEPANRTLLDACRHWRDAGDLLLTIDSAARGPVDGWPADGRIVETPAQVSVARDAGVGWIGIRLSSGGPVAPADCAGADFAVVTPAGATLTTRPALPVPLYSAAAGQPVAAAATQSIAQCIAQCIGVVLDQYPA